MLPSLPGGPCWELPGTLTVVPAPSSRRPGCPLPSLVAGTDYSSSPQTYKLGAEQLLPRLRGPSARPPLLLKPPHEGGRAAVADGEQLDYVLQGARPGAAKRLWMVGARRGGRLRGGLQEEQTSPAS